MTIIKLSSSGKQFQVISDDGVVFGTSVEWVKGLFSGKSKTGFVLLTRMPWKVAVNRYKPSPVYNPVSGEKELYESVVDESVVGSDAQSLLVTSKSRLKKSFKDKKVW